AARLVGEVGLLPEARVPLVRDARFASDGETVWVVSGDGPGSLESGTQPTRISAARVEAPEGAEGEVQVSLWRTAMVVGAGAPLRLAMTRGRIVASGATIRLPPEKTTVRFSAVDRALLGLDLGKEGGAPG